MWQHAERKERVRMKADVSGPPKRRIPRGLSSTAWSVASICNIHVLSMYERFLCMKTYRLFTKTRVTQQL